MQLVFVHGVSTRTSAAYDIEEKNRDDRFRAAAFRGTALTIRSPRWGDLVPPLRFGGAAFATDDAIAFGSAAPEAAVVLSENGQASIDLKGSPPADLVDVIGAELADLADREGRVLKPEELAGFADLTRLIEEGSPLPKPEADETEDFGMQLAKAADEDASFSGNPIMAAFSAISDRARNVISAGLSAAVRPSLNPLVARFLGDVFIYLKPGAIREGIRTIVREAIHEADAARKDGEPLILMGHSLGGVILFDMLSNPEASGLRPDLKVDAFVTVGSQSGLFEELGLFVDDRTDDPVQGPASVATWINVFDPIDLFGFKASPIFQLAEDFAFNSVTGLISSHTTYFKRPEFHARLRRRLIEAGVIGGAS